MKKISVIVPVYNTGKYIEKCLDSLVNQTLKDIEIIIVNDGSTDNSEKIIKNYLKNYPDMIIYLKKKNGGQGSARNLAFKYVTGKYIGFIDSDDFIDKNMYENMYNTAIKTNSDIVICDGCDYYEENNREKYFNLNLNVSPTIQEAFIKSVPSVVNKIYKKELIINNNLKFVEKIWYEDLPFSLFLITKAKKISYINQPFYYYFHRKRSTMHNKNIEKNLDIIKAFEILKKYLIKENKFDKLKEEFNYLLLTEVYIATITRIIRTRTLKSDKKNIINELKTYIKNNNILNFKNNKYFNNLSRNQKIIYNLIAKKHYNLIYLIFKIKEKMK